MLVQFNTSVFNRAAVSPLPAVRMGATAQAPEQTHHTRGEWKKTEPAKHAAALLPKWEGKVRPELPILSQLPHQLERLLEASAHARELLTPSSRTRLQRWEDTVRPELEVLSQVSGHVERFLEATAQARESLVPSSL